MGLHFRSKFDVDTTDETIIAKIKQYMDSKDKHAFDLCYRKFSPNSKWSAYDLIIDTSRKFPNQIFMYSEIAEHYGVSTYLYKNGFGLNYDFVMGPPKFPSNKQWNDALARLKKYEAEKKAREEQAAKEKQEADRIALIERTKREIEEKQALLKNLV